MRVRVHSSCGAVRRNIEIDEIHDMYEICGLNIEICVKLKYKYISHTKSMLNIEIYYRYTEIIQPKISQNPLPIRPHIRNPC